MPFSCVLVSDITGSTQLYETHSNQAALGQVDQVLTRMRQIVEAADGHCVKSQGDDVLSFFETSEAAFQAAWTMIGEEWPGSLSIHAGMYFGEILSHESDIYGDAVNTAARLASLAKPDEVLVGENCYEGLSQGSKEKLLLIGGLQLRGKKVPTQVYACSVVEMSEQTVIFAKPKDDRVPRTESAELSFNGQIWQVGEGESLSIGRSAENDIVMQEAWVSRRHAALSLRRGQLEFTDHSSTGSILVLSGGEKVSVHRRATLVSGDGTLQIGAGAEPSTQIEFASHMLSLQLVI